MLSDNIKSTQGENMKKIAPLLLTLAALIFSGCGQNTNKLTQGEKELSTVEIVASMKAVGASEEIIQTFEEATKSLAESKMSAQYTDAQRNLAYSIGTGTVMHYEGYYSVRSNYTAYNWGRDGCSSPSAVKNILSTTDTVFRRACNVHDFAYRNFPNFGMGSLLNREYYRLQADNAFLINMNWLCSITYSGTTKGVCYAAALEYFSAVRVFGVTKYGT